MTTFSKQVDWIISRPNELEFKINGVAEALWFEIGSKLEAQVRQLAEDIVLDRIEVPSVVEFTCPIG